MKKEYKIYFPYSKIRPIQKTAFDFIFSNLNSKKYIILEGPVGSGKSAIAYTLSKWILNNYKPSCDFENGSYIVTTQKILQEQYINDFNDIAYIWSKSNYTCKHRKNMSCDDGQRLAQIFSDSKESKKCNIDCVYNTEFKKFLANPIGVTNTAYILNQLTYNKSEKLSLKKRALLVIDECHNLEQAIVNFVSTKIYKNFCEEDLEIDYINDENLDLLSIKKWISDIFMKGLEDKILNITDEILSIDPKKQKVRPLVKKYNDLDKIKCKTDRFIKMFNEKNWVVTKENDYFELKPIYINQITQSLLFNISEKILLMSGTILNHETFCQHVGIPIEESCFLSMDSPFKKENRKIFISNIASMNYKNIDSGIKNINNAVQYLLSQHRGQKGIIHTHTYKIAKYLKDNDKTKRLLIHETNNRNEILNKHIKSKHDTVLVSPSFTEGIDLIDEYSRFQIICKIPFPYLKDNYIIEKMKKCKNWYEWQVAKTIIQALGRSVRSENDYAISYILDSDWNFFYNKNNFLFPKWFKDSIIFL